ncbi:MAG: response regulator [SAR324 cluster bacterium]|jgi:two-component system, OmpR family, response regulator MprA|nr:response regulator [SAR324 cluster bacterium]
MNIQEVQELISANIVLVAEDEPMLRESLQQMLGYFFAQVDAEADGQEALDQLAENSCGIVLTDLRMWRMSGSQLLQEIR